MALGQNLKQDHSLNTVVENIVASLSWASPADGAGAVGAGRVTGAAGVVAAAKAAAGAAAGAGGGAGAGATAAALSGRIAVGGAKVVAGDIEVDKGAGQFGGLDVAAVGVEGTGSSSPVGLVGLASFSSPFI